ncbi:MAG: ATP-binding protein [Alphaproteobacteria bacterium]|nr:ATP-binding protein [Alphaproteobacteria bacterium]MCY3755785.1 ATP-binding protein [Alphaproteobacteria bacterium]
MSANVEVPLAADLGELSRLAEAVEDFGGANDVPPGAVFKLNLCFDELITNAISYGFDAPDKASLSVALAVEDGAVVAVIRDNGRPFDPFTEAPEADTTLAVEDRPIGGLGVLLVRESMDDFSYERRDGFNVVTLRLKLDGQETP